MQLAFVVELGYVTTLLLTVENYTTACDGPANIFSRHPRYLVNNCHFQHTRSYHGDANVLFVCSDVSFAGDHVAKIVFIVYSVTLGRVFWVLSVAPKKHQLVKCEGSAQRSGRCFSVLQRTRTRKRQNGTNRCTSKSRTVQTTERQQRTRQTYKAEVTRHNPKATRKRQQEEGKPKSNSTNKGTNNGQ